MGEDKVDIILQMMRDHVASSNGWRDTMSKSITKIETHNRYTIEACNRHETEIKSLNESRTKQNTAIKIISWLGSGLFALLAFFKGQ